MLVISATSTAPLRKLTVQAIHSKKANDKEVAEQENKNSKASDPLETPFTLGTGSSKPESVLNKLSPKVIQNL